MRIGKTLFASLSVVLLFISSAAIVYADPVTFTGTVDTGSGPPRSEAPDPARCGAFPPNLLLTAGPGTGTSNLGSFTQTLSHCVNLATGSLSNGLFALDFGSGNTIVGTVTGTITLPPVAGVAPFEKIFTVTGGTGVFTGATGTFTQIGTAVIGATTQATFSGTINVVPEPTTMLLLGSGLAGICAAVRKRRR